MATETILSSGEEQREAFILQAEHEAIDAVAQRQGLVTDVRREHHETIEALLSARASQDDPQAAAEVLQETDEVKQEIDRRADERASRFHDGVRVAHLPGTIVGMQEDADRSVLIDSGLVHSQSDAAQVREVDKHEFRHTQQEGSNDDGDVPVTGNSQVDALLQLGETEYREKDAMQYAGDSYTSQQYHHDYKRPGEQVEEYLNDGGLNGRQLVLDAGLNGKVQEIRRAILQVYVENELAQAA